MKILVVDDSSTMRKMVMRVLNMIGYDDLTQAENGKEALDTIEKTDIDLVVTDWNMPVMNGLEFVRNLRSGPHSAMPVLMVTTNSAEKDLQEAQSAGIQHYVVKPFTPVSLKECIEKCIADTKG